MAYHWGQLNDIIATRIVLPFLLLQVLVCVWVCGRSRYRFRVTGLALAVAAVFFVGRSRPLMAEGKFLIGATELHEAQWLREQAIKHRHEDPLFISNKHLVVLAERTSGLPAVFAKNRKPELELHRRLQTFGAIYFVYKVEPTGEDGEWRPAMPLHRDFELEVVAEEKLSETHYVRMARLERVRFLPEDPEPIRPEALRQLRDEVDRLKFYAKTLP